MPPQDPQPPASSPCTGVCRLGDHGYCDGCGRSMGEIAAWGRMSEGERRHLLQTVLPQRREPRR